MSTALKKTFVALILLLITAGAFAQNQIERAAVSALLEHIPETCKVLGVWRDTDYPPALYRDFANTVLLCEDSAGLTVYRRFDKDGSLMMGPLNEARAMANGDIYTINPGDSSLTISDDFGPVKTLAAFPLE